jgi:hypothetical protein
MKAKPIDLGDQTPGTILHDFQAMLDIIGKEGLSIAGAKGLFPMDRLADMDARLAMPLKPALKRPQLRSYPNLTGLYMLLRSSGMGLLESHGSRRRLVLNVALSDRWQQLSPADRYWNLLGVWWILSRTTGIGDRANALSELVWAVRAMDNAGSPSNELLTSWMPAICLAAMFGIAEVSLHHQPGELVWRIASRCTPVGTQLRGLFGRLMGEKLPLLRLNSDLRAEPSVRMQKFKRLIQPIAPQWRELLLPLTPPATFKGTLQIKVSLDKVWCRFDAPSTATLDDLAENILAAYKFDDDHLYEFRVASPTGETIQYTHFAMNEGVPADQTTLGEVPFRLRQKSAFQYDFGEDWRFDILIEAMDPRASRSIKLIESQGKAPKQYNSW